MIVVGGKEKAVSANDSSKGKRAIKMCLRMAYMGLCYKLRRCRNQKHAQTINNTTAQSSYKSEDIINLNTKRIIEFAARLVLNKELRTLLSVEDNLSYSPNSKLRIHHVHPATDESDANPTTYPRQNLNW